MTTSTRQRLIHLTLEVDPVLQQGKPDEDIFEEILTNGYIKGGATVRFSSSPLHEIMDEEQYLIEQIHALDEQLLETKLLLRAVRQRTNGFDWAKAPSWA